MRGVWSQILWGDREPPRGQAPRLLVVEDGRIVESGSHEELIEQTGSYAELYEMQSSQ